jgi:hypothetical protein
MESERVLPFIARKNDRSQTPRPTTRPISLLSVGKDIEILAEREWGLRKAGYGVHSLTVETLLLRRLAVIDTVALFCHTLDTEECLFLAAHMRRYSPKSRLILLTKGDRYRLESVLFHATVRSEDGLEALCQEIDKLASAA